MVYMRNHRQHRRTRICCVVFCPHPQLVRAETQTNKLIGFSLNLFLPPTLLYSKIRFTPHDNKNLIIFCGIRLKHVARCFTIYIIYELNRTDTRSGWNARKHHHHHHVVLHSTGFRFDTPCARWAQAAIIQLDMQSYQAHSNANQRAPSHSWSCNRITIWFPIRWNMPRNRPAVVCQDVCMCALCVCGAPYTQPLSVAF